MNEMLVQENLDKLVNIVTQIKHSGNDNEGLLKVNSYLADMKDALNTLLTCNDYKFTCLDILYTLNLDNEYFGVIVNPMIDGITSFKIFATSEPVVITNYQLELDSRMFMADLSAEEIVSIVVFEVTSMLNPGQIDHVRSLIDLHVLSDDDVIHLRDSVNYNQLITYAIKDTLYKVSSILFKEDTTDIESNIFIQMMNLQDVLISAQEKLISNVFGMSDSVRSPKTVILQWVFLIYQDIKGYSRTAIETLKDAKQFTASKLLGIEIDKTITAIDRADNSIIKESSLNKFFDRKALYSLNELGLFKSLKLSGLRSIEDDYYTLSVQAKTIETEADAMFVIRSINSRLSILEDYIYNNELKESDKKHWMGVAKQYRELRNFVVNKKISKRKYSDIFMDYDDFPSDNKNESAEFTSEVDDTTNSNERLVSKEAIKQMDQLKTVNESVISEGFVDKLKKVHLKPTTKKLQTNKNAVPEKKDTRIRSLKSIDLENALYESDSTIAGCKVKLKLTMQQSFDSDVLQNINIVIDYANKYYLRICQLVFAEFTKLPPDSITLDALNIKCKDALVDMYIDDNSFYTFRVKMLLSSALKDHEKVVAGICINSKAGESSIRYWDKWPLD